MTVEELNKVFDELKEEGLSEEDIAKAIGKLFEDGDLSKEEFGAFLRQVGYDVTDKFENMSEEEARKSLWDDDSDKEDDYDELSDEEKEEFEESGDEEAPDAPLEDSEEDDKKKAMKLMGLEKDED